MTRQHGPHSETTQSQVKNKRILLLKMRSENSDFYVLGNFVYGGDENDYFQKQCEHTSSSGLVDSA